jgi:hypothetical protein
LEALRVSLEVAGITYRRLVSTLAAATADLGAGRRIEVPSAPAFADAWTLVDTADRLQRLLGRRPRSMRSSRPPPPDVQATPTLRDFLELFRRAALPVREMRNAVQHLENELVHVAARGDTVWGSLAWVSPISTTACRSSVLVGGTLMDNRAYMLVNPVGRKIAGPVDHITLTAFEQTANLSEMHGLMLRIAAKFEDQLRPQIAGMTTGTVDFVASAEIEMGGHEHDNPTG